jgi:hypothetical protein
VTHILHLFFWLKSICFSVENMLGSNKGGENLPTSSKRNERTDDLTRTSTTKNRICNEVEPTESVTAGLIVLPLFCTCFSYLALSEHSLTNSCGVSCYFNKAACTEMQFKLPGVSSAEKLHQICLKVLFRLLYAMVIICAFILFSLSEIYI